LPDNAWFGMTTRVAGRSRGPYASFNVSLGVGDDEADVRANRAALRLAVGYDREAPHLLHQVHGARIVGHRDAPTEADGFLVHAADPWVGVSAADCAPVAVVADDGSRGALLHSGWRGAVAGIAAAAVRALTEDGAAVESHTPSRLRAVIGPCIHACCFPVGPEVVAQFDPSLHRPHPSGQIAIDLPGAIRRQLVASGVPDDRIHTASECTSCTRERFYSYRRDGSLTGRHWALLHLD
jgi:YfiH family protein